MQNRDGPAAVTERKKDGPICLAIVLSAISRRHTPCAASTAYRVCGATIRQDEKARPDLGSGVRRPTNAGNVVLFVGKRARDNRCWWFHVAPPFAVCCFVGLFAGRIAGGDRGDRIAGRIAAAGGSSLAESARRMTCLNNLHQIGLGALAFHDVYNRYPEGGVEMRSLRGPDGKVLYPNGRQLAWSAYILPYVELQSLAKRIDFRKAFDSPENAAAAAEIVPLYLCPSNPRPSYLSQGRGACDYGGIFGEVILTNNNPPRGIMLYGQYVRIRDVVDGTSHTMMVSEDSWSQDMQWINGLNVFDVSAAINTAQENDLHSKHAPRGVNGLMADGNARFISEDIDLGILAAICTRNGREPVGEF